MAVEIDVIKKIERGFVEHITEDHRLLYADTDSAYISLKLPFSKFEDQKKVVEYSQNISKRINKEYNQALELYCAAYGGLVPEYNTMDFKSEVVAYKGFFNTKKFYALSKLWDEGTFYPEPELKYTGGQYKKADITKITKDMIKEIYDISVMDIHETNINKIAKIIFVDIKNKYTEKLKNHIRNLDIDEFSIPKKWGFSEKKIPKWVEGAKLYNTLINDVFRPGDSLRHIQLRIDMRKLENYAISRGLNIKSNEFINISDPGFKKLDSISIPPDISDIDKQRLFNIFTELNIEPDFDSIVHFNIGKKIQVFEKLFDEKILRLLK